MELVQLHKRPKDWNDRIKQYDTKTLFHEASWHNHIESINKSGKMLYFSIEKDNSIIGYFCGLAVRKSLIKIMGSPLGGTGTNYMGPIVNRDINQYELIPAIDRMCRSLGIMHIEISNNFFDFRTMENQKYIKYHCITNLIELPDTEEEAFSNMRSACRNRIRKANKNNLIVELMCDGSIVDHFFEQFKEVYGKQGMARPFGKDRVESLYKCLYNQKRLLPIMIKKNDEVIATGLFPYDENAIYFWGGASWLKHQKLCPNELLHWSVIKFSIENNIREYNLCGGQSQFKNKFGGADVDFFRYSKSNFAPLKYARDLYRNFHWFKLKIKGKFSN